MAYREPAPLVVVPVPLWRRAARWEWFRIFFNGCRWYRRLHGGHWELWWVEPCSTALWHDCEGCMRERGVRPVACFGRPTCEDWP